MDGLAEDQVVERRPADPRPRPAGDRLVPGDVVRRADVGRVAEVAPLHEAEPERRRQGERFELLLADGAEPVVALRKPPPVDLCLALEGRGLDPARAVGRDGEDVVAVGRKLLDRELAGRVRQAVAPRARDRVGNLPVPVEVDELAGGVLVVTRAERVVVVVDRDLADVVLEDNPEARHVHVGVELAQLRRVRRRVHRGVVREDADLDLRERQRGREHRHLDGLRRVHDRKVLAPELVARGRDAHEVAARVEVDSCARLVPQRHGRARARHRLEPRMLQRVGVARKPGVVGVDQVAEIGDRRPGLAVFRRDGDVDGEGLGGEKQRCRQRSQGYDQDPRDPTLPLAPDAAWQHGLSYSRPGGRPIRDTSVPAEDSNLGR